MSGLLRSPRVQLVLRLVLGAFFVYASLDKIWSPAAFAKIVYQWQVAGPVPSNLVAVTLPWVELLAGLLLVAGVWKRESALVIALMLVVFIVSAGSVMARGIDVENCGCVSVAKAEARLFLAARLDEGRRAGSSSRATWCSSARRSCSCWSRRRDRAPRPRPPESTVSDTTTRGVRVEVRTAYVPERSSPQDVPLLLRLSHPDLERRRGDGAAPQPALGHQRRRREHGARAGTGRRRGAAGARSPASPSSTRASARSPPRSARCTGPTRWSRPAARPSTPRSRPFSLAVPTAVN